MAQIQIDLFNLTLYLGVAVGLLTFALLGYIMWKFRYRPEAPEPQQVHGNTTLEVAWTLFPALIVAVIAVFTVQGHLRHAARAARQRPHGARASASSGGGSSSTP